MRSVEDTEWRKGGEGSAIERSGVVSLMIVDGPGSM